MVDRFDAQSPLSQLLELMERLRDPKRGCSWDKAQTFRTIAPYTIEEAYEVFDAIEREDLDALKEELGDLLFQVVFHAQMAKEQGAFDFSDVSKTIVAKMIARHPHVFGAQNSGHDENEWERQKQEERQAKGEHSAVGGVAKALPALKRAEKLQKRAARVGFDWPDPQGPRTKILEELEEFDHAQNERERVEEAGDLLFAAVNFLRANGVDAEAALRRANAKFERRFRAMEERAKGAFAQLTLDEQEALWQEVKRQEN